MLPQPATSALARPTTRRRKVEAVQAWEQTKVAPRMPVQALMMMGWMGGVGFHTWFVSSCCRLGWLVGWLVARHNGRVHAPQGDEPPPPRDQGREEEGAGAEEEEADDAELGAVPVDERADGEAGFCWLDLVRMGGFRLALVGWGRSLVVWTCRLLSIYIQSNN